MINNADFRLPLALCSARCTRPARTATDRLIWSFRTQCGNGARCDRLWLHGLSRTLSCRQARCDSSPLCRVKAETLTIEGGGGRIAKAGTQVIIPYRDEDDKRHLKVTGDLGQIVSMVRPPFQLSFKESDQMLPGRNGTSATRNRSQSASGTLTSCTISLVVITRQSVSPFLFYDKWGR